MLLPFRLNSRQKGTKNSRSAPTEWGAPAGKKQESDSVFRLAGKAYRFDSARSFGDSLVLQCPSERPVFSTALPRKPPCGKTKKARRTPSQISCFFQKAEIFHFRADFPASRHDSHFALNDSAISSMRFLFLRAFAHSSGTSP